MDNQAPEKSPAVKTIGKEIKEGWSSLLARISQLRRTSISDPASVITDISNTDIFSVSPDYPHKMKIDTNAVLIKQSDEFPNLPVQPDILKAEVDRSAQTTPETNPSDQPLTMWAMEGMGRSVILPGAFEFSSKNGNKFFFISIKGVGMTDARIAQQNRTDLKAGNGVVTELATATNQGETYHQIRTDSQDIDHIEGASAVDSLQADFDNSLILHRNGVRTSLPIAIFNSSIGGKETRAFRNYERVNQLVRCAFKPPDDDSKTWEPAYAKGASMIDNAKILLSREANFGVVKSDSDYLKVFSVNMGKNLGIEHRIGYIHRRETNAGGLDAMQNVTLAMEVVDHDTGEFANRKNQDDKDLLLNQYLLGLLNVVAVYETVSKIRGTTPEEFSRDQLITQYTTEYTKQLDPIQRLQMKGRLKEVLVANPTNFSFPETNVLALGNDSNFANPKGTELHIFVNMVIGNFEEDTRDYWTNTITNFWSK